MIKRLKCILLSVLLLIPFGINVSAAVDCKIVDVSTRDMLLENTPNTLEITIGSLLWDITTVSVEVYEGGIDRNRSYEGKTTVPNYDWNTNAYGKAVISVPLGAYPKGTVRYCIRLTQENGSESLSTATFTVYEWSNVKQALLVSQNPAGYACFNELLKQAGAELIITAVPSLEQLQNADLIVLGSNGFFNLPDSMKELLMDQRKDIFLFKDGNLADVDPINTFFDSAGSGIRIYGNNLVYNGGDEILSSLYGNGGIKYEIVSPVQEQDTQIKNKPYKAFEASPIYTISTGGAGNTETLVKNVDQAVCKESGKGFPNSSLLCVDILKNNSKLAVAGSDFLSDAMLEHSADNMYGLLFANNFYDTHLMREFSNYYIGKNLLEWLLPKGQYTSMNIRDVKTMRDMEGSYVEVTGVVTMDSEDANRAINGNNAFHDCIYLEDETGGIRLLGVATAPIGNTSGYKGFIVKARGVVGCYNGEMEIRIFDESRDLRTISRKDSSRKPTQIKADEIKEDTLGNLVQVGGMVTGVMNNMLTVHDGSGNILIYLDDYIGSTSTGLIGTWPSGVGVGVSINVCGIVSRQGEDTVVRVGDTDEIQIISSSATLSPTPGATYNPPPKGKPLILYSSDAFQKIQSELDGKNEPFVFDDVQTHWARDVIMELFMAGVIHGTQGNLFMPDEAITRAEFVALLVRVSNKAETVESHFADVTEHDWYYESVSAALAQGLVEDTSLFYPNRAITRQEMAVMAARYLKLEGLEDVVSYSDRNQISDWALGAVGALTEKGIMQGSENLFMPLKTSTRAEAAQIIFNIRKESGVGLHE